MKTLLAANQKGGVGKSAIVTQFAYYLHLIMKLRVLVIDLDHQRNTSKAIETSGLAVIAPITSDALLTSVVTSAPASPFVLVPGSPGLLALEKQGEEAHNGMAGNLIDFIEAVAGQFDVCLIDTNPNPDIRQLAALIASDYVVSPIQLNQEAIDGIGDLLNHRQIGINRIVETGLNPNLKFIGILPNLVEPTPFQRDNFADLAAAFSSHLIAMGDDFAKIKKSTAIAEAQAAGLPVWKLAKKTSARECWANISPVFKTIAAQMELPK